MYEPNQWNKIKTIKYGFAGFYVLAIYMYVKLLKKKIVKTLANAVGRYPELD